MTSTLSENQLDLSILLPAYLEEENLRILLPRLRKVASEMGISSEIVVLDTESPLDKTASVCKDCQVTYLPRNGGNRFGDAVRTGIASAKGKHILFMDADGSHTPEFIPELWKHATNYDVVIASRYIDGGYTENSASLVWMSRILNFTYSVVLGLNCKDVSNSFKIYDSQLLKSLKLRSHNFDIVEEILYKMKCKRPGLKIKEVPFSFKKRMFGDTKRNLFLFILTYIMTMVRLRLDSE